MQFLILKLIYFYQRYVSIFMPPHCRYVPSCSEYAVVAIEKYGFLRGGWLSVKRLFRCHPFHKSSCFDPVTLEDKNH